MANAVDTLQDDPLRTTDEAAPRIKSNPRTMERWRQTGQGPAFVKVGHRVVYRESALRAFLDQQTRTHTGETRSGKRV